MPDSPPDSPVDLEAGRLGRISVHALDGTDFTLYAVAVPRGEDTGGAARWFRAAIGPRMIAEPMMLTISESGSTTKWRVPIGGTAGPRVEVCVADLPSALLLARDADAAALVRDALAGMYGAGQRVTYEGRVFRLVVPKTPSGPLYVEVREAEALLARARPYAHKGSVWWQVGYAPPGMGDEWPAGTPLSRDIGDHVAGVRGILRIVSSRCDGPSVRGGVLRGFSAELAALGRRAERLCAAVPSAHKLESLSRTLGYEARLLDEAAADLDRWWRRPAGVFDHVRGIGGDAEEALD